MFSPDANPRPYVSLWWLVVIHGRAVSRLMLMSAMGGKRTLATLPRELRPTPRTVGNHDHAGPTVVHHNTVRPGGGPIVDQAIRTVVAVGVSVAGVLDVGAHHLAAVISHATVCHMWS